MVAGLVLPWPAALMAWWTLLRIGPDQAPGEVASTAAVMAAVAALIVSLLASVRCPQCGCRLIRRVLLDPEGLNGLTALIRTRTCPECGHNPRSLPAAG